MKKTIKQLLILIISIFIIPVIVNADMGAPESYQYEVIVINTNGAILYDWEGKKTGDVIPYDTKITVGYEHKINGELYVEAYSSYEEEEEDTIEGMIKISDIKLFTTEIDFSKLYANTDGRQYYAFKDTELYKGPSTVYGKIDGITIPAGTTIDYTYESSPELTQWIYTEYNGTKGWIFAFAMSEISPYDIECTVALKSKGKIMIIGDLDVYDYNGNVIGTVKDLEEYEYLYILSPGPKSSAYYIKGENIEGWIYNEYYGAISGNIVHNIDEKYLLIDKNGTEVYEDYNLTKKVKNVTIPFGTEINTTYCISIEEKQEDSTEYVYRCLTTYNGKKYWVKETETTMYYHSDYVITTSEEQKMYKYNDDTELLDITIPANVTLETKWEYYDYSENGSANNIDWYYVEYEGTKGWIYIDKSANNAKVEEEEVNPPEEEKEEEEEETPESIPENNKKEISPKEKAYIAIGAAVLLSLGALFTILLINKKKKIKKEEQKTEEVTPVEENKPEKEDKE